MKVRSLLYNVLILIFAALVVNQMACSNASFESEDSVVGQRAANPDNPKDGDDDPDDDNDSVRCARGRNSSSKFCKRDRDRDDGDGTKIVIKPGKPGKLPPLTFTPPRCETKKTPRADRPDLTCYTTVCADLTKTEIDGVSLWLVVDSSRSFDGEREAVAKAIAGGFLTALKKNVPVTISVIAGHAPSPGVYSGPVPADPEYGLGPRRTVRTAAPFYNSKAFYRQASEPLSITLYPSMSDSEFKRARRQLLLKLDNHMTESPMSLARQQSQRYEYKPGKYHKYDKRGPHSGSDELLLRNFSDAMKRVKIPKKNAWIVLFASDENDVCVPQKNKAGKNIFSHPDEKDMLEWYCDGITARRVFRQAEKYAGDRAWAMGALVYTGQNPIPSYAHKQAKFGEGSFGAGFTTIVSLAGPQHGVMIDLARRKSDRYDKLDEVASRIVSELAKNIRRTMGIHTEFVFVDEKGRRLRYSDLNRISGNYDLQVKLDGVRCSYDVDDKVYHLVKPYDHRGRIKINEVATVEMTYCLKKKKN